MKQTDDIPSPPPHWLHCCHWRGSDKWTKCLQEFSGPGSRVGAIISNDHKLSPTSPGWESEDPIFTIGHLSPSSRESAEPPRHDPVLIIKTPAGEPGQWRANYRWWWPGHHCVSCTPPPPVSADWCLRHSIRQQSIHQTKAWDRSRVTPVDGCQAVSAPTCVTIIPARLSSQKIIISGIGPVKIITTWFMSCTFI